MTTLVGSLALIAIIGSGLALIVAPSAVQELFKRTATGLGLMVYGLMLLQVCCAQLHR